MAHCLGLALDPQGMIAQKIDNDIETLSGCFDRYRFTSGRAVETL